MTPTLNPVKKVRGCQVKYRGVVRDKVKYRTLRDAETGLFQFIDHNPNDPTAYRLGVYECGHCGWYHVGHSPLYTKSEKRRNGRDEALVGILIGFLKHIINGDPLPQTNDARKLLRG